jgi:hypothetical protein
MVTPGCGKKGPPLAPLRIAPAPVTELSARRMADRVVLRFSLPERNDNNSTPVDLERVDVYALSVPKAADAPDGPDFLEQARVVAAVKVTPQTPARASVTETLTPADFKPAPIEKPVERRQPPVTAAKPPPPDPTPVRLYAVVPVSSKGRHGRASMTTVPIVEAPPAPETATATYSEKSVTLEWTPVADPPPPPVPSLADTPPPQPPLNAQQKKEEGEEEEEEEAEAPKEQKLVTPETGQPTPAPTTEPQPSHTQYNVYEAAKLPAAPPLNTAPLDEPRYEDPGIQFGAERCYGVTAVWVVGRVPVESAPSSPVCVTPLDTFPPAAPEGLGAVAGPGSISLIWNAAAAPDLAGYLVLRAEAPDDTLQALTPEPIRETTYRDTAVRPGVRYVYAVAAVDRAKNVSAQSARVEETAR